MPKDEDILQLVSPALLSEVEDPWGLGARYSLSPWVSLLHQPFREAEKRVEGQHQRRIAQSWMPGPSLGWGWLLLHSGLLCVGGGEVLALAGRIPARVSGKRVAQRALPDWHVLVDSREMPVPCTPSLPGPE